MDAIEYIKTKARMCDGSCEICATCPMNHMNNKRDLDCDDFVDIFPNEAVDIVEKWANEHPIMTNAMKFKEVFGCEPENGVGMKYMCAPKEHRQQESPYCLSNDCTNCQKWWEEEYKEHKDDK